MKTLILFILIFSLHHLNVVSQNIGIGTTSPQAKLDVVNSLRVGGASKFLTYDSTSGRLFMNNSNLLVLGGNFIARHSTTTLEGLYYNGVQLEYRNASGSPIFFTNHTNGNGFFDGNLGINRITPRFPLSFSNNTGTKISLWDDGNPAGANYGIGIQNGMLQFHTYTVNDDVVFGYGTSANLNETFRFKGTGALVVNGSTGTTGQVLKSNGNARPSWEFPVKTYWWPIDGFANFSSTSEVSIFSQSFTTSNPTSSLIISAQIKLFTNPCFACADGKGSAFVYVDGILVSHFFLLVPGDNGATSNSLPNFIMNVPAGNHTIELKAVKSGGSNFNISTASAGSYVSIVVVSQ